MIRTRLVKQHWAPMALAGMAMFSCVVGAQEKAAPVETQEQIKFEQDKAQANMRELEERMFSLAKLIREAQPEDSSRLLMGVQKAREFLLVEKMGEAANLLNELKLELAASEQTELLGKLEELKRLLLTSDIDLEMKLQQLRKIRQAREQLAKLIDREQQQKRSTDSENDPAKLKDLEQGEKSNQRIGEDLEQRLSQIGSSASGAAGAVGGACACMGKAGSSLGKSQPKEASPQQQMAIEKLKDADKSLADAEQQLRKELEALVRQQVMERLTQMVNLQEEVRETTSKLQDRVTDGSVQAIAAVKRLAVREQEIRRIGDACIELCELTEFSIVFPEALRDVCGKIDVVKERLGEGAAGSLVVDMETEVIDDLRGLLDALRQAAKRDPNGGQGQCMGCQGNFNKLLAELKMVRQMETSLQTQTVRMDGQVAAGILSPEGRVTQCEPLKERQSKVLEVTERIAKEFSKEE